MQIITRSRNNTLYEMMRRCFWVRDVCIPYRAHGRARGAADYLHHLIRDNWGWVVNCDEDCFVSNREAIHELIDHMECEGYDYCGMPDGGVQPHRLNSWMNMNPFFNIFNLDTIRPLYEQFPRRDMDCWIPVDLMMQTNMSIPAIVTGPFDHNRNEPFAGLFYWLHDHFKPLYLDAELHRDGISTVLLDLSSQPFAYHSWYSRYYPKDPGHTARINALYAEACSTQ